jgi:dimethylsulfoniopropionate demethylase
LEVGPGCPNLIERIEAGLLSFGADMDYFTTPFEVGLDKYVSLESNIASLSIEALRTRRPTKKLVGLVMDQKITVTDPCVYSGQALVGDIRSQVWSPRYESHLAFAMCDLDVVCGLQTVEVKTSEGTINAVVTSLPFDFGELGLKG